MFSRKWNKPIHVLIAREDAMGDVILALPVCGLLKSKYPNCKISFLGRAYTRAVAMASEHVDEFLDFDEWNQLDEEKIKEFLQRKKIDVVVHLLKVEPALRLCKAAGIKLRIGAANIMLNWRYCNRLVAMTRKKSRLNEAQLNCKLLHPLGITKIPKRNEIHQYYGFSRLPNLDPNISSLLANDRFNIIFHPLSNKNAKEWGLHNFSALLKLLNPYKYRVFITGSTAEKSVLEDWVKQQGDIVIDLTGKLDANQLIAFIAAADGLIASSTGPVHIAAAAGIQTLGLYENRWVKRGERWGPLGAKASFLQCVNDNMDTITPELVYEKINQWH